MNQEQYYQQHQASGYTQNPQQPMYNPQVQEQQIGQQPAYQTQTVITPAINEKQVADNQHEGPTLVENAWKDVMWAIAFYVSVIAMVILAVMSIKQGKFDEVTKDLKDNEKKNFEIMPKLLFAGIGAGTLFTAMWLAVMTCCASLIIKFSLLLLPVAAFGGAVVSFVAGLIVTGVFSAIVGVIGCVYAYFVWKKIPFATVCLNIAIEAFYQFKMPLFVNLLCVILALGMLVIDTLAAPYILSIESAAAKYLSYFIWFVFAFWHMMVAMNVAHTAACGVMATFFFGRETKGVTWGAFKRAATTSFGSICFGSLLTAIIRALQMVVKMAKEDNAKSGNNAMAVVLACLECLIDLLGDILEYFNAYAYVQIAVYGKAYWDAAKDTFELFKSTGVDVIINDDLTSYPITVGAFLNIIVIVVAVLVLDRDFVTLSTLIAVFAGILIYYGTCQVLRSNVKTLFVCWAENPAEFSLNRPELFKKMVAAANKAGHNTAFSVIGNV